MLIMGSEQSSRRDREERNSKFNRPPTATAKDLEKALEAQRILYEQKMKDLLQKSKQESAAASSRPASTTDQQCSQPTSIANQILERQHTRYSHNQNDLQSMIRDPNRNLYPNLNSGLSPTSPAYPTAPKSNTHGGNNNGSSSGLVSTNSWHSAQRFQPSAPLEETAPTNFRSRTDSRRRGPDDEITCPTCKNLFSDKIYQCNQGHSSCNLCKMRQVPCGQCRHQITNCRNFELEKYFSERKVMCPNSADGCRLNIKMADMETHAKECPFKALKCPSLGPCPWIGKLSQLPSHFDLMHPTQHRQGDVDKEMFLSNISNTSHTMHYIRIGNFNFLFHIIVSESGRMVYMAAQLIGTKQSAAKWNYEVHVYNKSEPRRKFQSIDKCVSYSEPIHEIVESTNCTVLPLAYAKTFICSGALAYKFYIKRHEAQPKEFVNKKWRGPRRNAQ